MIVDEHLHQERVHVNIAKLSSSRLLIEILITARDGVSTNNGVVRVYQQHY